MMPNQRSLDVTDYKLRMSREQYRACKVVAASRGLSTQAFMRETLYQATGKGRTLLTQKQAAKLLGVHDWTLRVGWPSRGLHPPRVMRWGRLRGYDRDELLAWAAEHRLGTVRPNIA